MSDRYLIVYTWPDGRKEVRYRRPLSDKSLMHEVERLREKQGDACPYSVEFTEP